MLDFLIDSYIVVWILVRLLLSEPRDTSHISLRTLRLLSGCIFFLEVRMIYSRSWRWTLRAMWVRRTKCSWNCQCRQQARGILTYCCSRDDRFLVTYLGRPSPWLSLFWACVLCRRGTSTIPDPAVWVVASFVGFNMIDKDFGDRAVVVLIEMVGSIFIVCHRTSIISNL